jgi:hypothetical protein
MLRIVRLAAPAALIPATVLLTTCRLDQLISPPPIGSLTTSPTSIIDSAAVGSTGQRVYGLEISNPGERNVSWTASRGDLQSG